MIYLDLLVRCLEKVNIFSHMVVNNGALPWYKIKHDLKQVTVDRQIESSKLQGFFGINSSGKQKKQNHLVMWNPFIRKPSPNFQPPTTESQIHIVVLMLGKKQIPDMSDECGKSLMLQ